MQIKFGIPMHYDTYCQNLHVITLTSYLVQREMDLHTNFAEEGIKHTNPAWHNLTG
jgi:hypothetical protein